MTIEGLLNSYPRKRPPLTSEYQAIFEREYKLSRTGGNVVSKMAQQTEAWMHRQVSRFDDSGRVLELGAGTLNHLPYETTQDYDIVEPFRKLYQDNPLLKRVQNVYEDVEDVPSSNRYNRIFSIAVLEHIERLPNVVARSGLLLKEGGLFLNGIPSEGGFVWGMAWRLTTGLSFRLRNGLSYKPLIQHEHINSAQEIVQIIHHFFGHVQCRWFPLPGIGLSMFCHIQASQPHRDVCEHFLSR